MSVNQPDPDRTRLSVTAAVIWRSVQVAVAVAVVVVPFAYAVTGVHREVLIAASCGFAMGVGLSLRMGERGGRSTGILIGSAVGITPASLAARTLVGARLLLSVGWALVVFAAVMSAIQPQLERIARRNTRPAPGDEQPES